MRKIENILIDLDGTLINVNESQAKLEFCYHLITHWKDKGNFFKILNAFHQSAKEMKSYNHSKISNYERGLRALSKNIGLSTEEVAYQLMKFLNECFPKLKKHFQLKKEANQFIQWAKENNLKLHLATNPLWPLEIVEMRLNWAGIDIKDFSSVSHAKYMFNSKNYVDYYIDFMQINNLKSENCIMIGNDTNKDGLAKLIGIKVVILSNKYPKLINICTHISQNMGAWSGDFTFIKNYIKGKKSHDNSCYWL